MHRRVERIVGLIDDEIVVDTVERCAHLGHANVDRLTLSTTNLEYGAKDDRHS